MKSSFFFADKPSGNLSIKILDKHWFSHDCLGEISIPLDGIPLNSEIKEWYTLENEPKKKHGKGTPAEIRLSLFFPSKNNDETPSERIDINEKFTLGEELGRGGFSIVKRGIEKETGDAYAIKIISKNQSEEELNLLRREIDIMKKLKHDNIVSLHSVFEDNDTMFLVMELATGGELFDQIINKGVYSEQDAAFIIQQILEAISYMHGNGICHRDLKPENLLVTGSDNDIIKISDFGLSKDFGKENLKTSCGTPDYVAPEVLRGAAYDNTVDVWSVGVITYILLCGFPPFYGNTDQQIFGKILRCEYDFPSPDWDSISDEGKEFIRALLVLNPNDRPSASQCLEAPWISNKNLQKLSRLDKLQNGIAEHKDRRKKYVPDDSVKL